MLITTHEPPSKVILRCQHSTETRARQQVSGLLRLPWEVFIRTGRSLRSGSFLRRLQKGMCCMLLRYGTSQALVCPRVLGARRLIAAILVFQPKSPSPRACGSGCDAAADRHGEIGYHLALKLAREKGLSVTMIQDSACKQATRLHTKADVRLAESLPKGL